MNEWKASQELGRKEIELFPVGTRVRLRFDLQAPPGEVIEVLPPWGLLSPGFRCRWDNGKESGWLKAVDIIKVDE